MYSMWARAQDGILPRSMRFRTQEINNIDGNQFGARNCDLPLSGPSLQIRHRFKLLIKRSHQSRYRVCGLPPYSRRSLFDHSDREHEWQARARHLDGQHAFHDVRRLDQSVCGAMWGQMNTARTNSSATPLGTLYRFPFLYSFSGARTSRCRTHSCE